MMMMMMMRIKTCFVLLFPFLFDGLMGSMIIKEDVGGESTKRECFESLLRNCCLKTLCSLYGDYPSVKTMCEMNECVFGDQRISHINKDTINSGFEENCANCSRTVNSFRTSSTLPTPTVMINSENTSETRSEITATVLASENNRSISENVTAKSPRIAKLQFLDVPKGDHMHIPDLGLDQEYLPFDGFSRLMGYLQPTGLPLELIRDAIRGEIPIHHLTVQLMKMETIAVIWVAFWTILAFCLPLISLSYLCCPKGNMRRLNEESSESSSHQSGTRTETILTVILHLLLIIFLLPVIMILMGNEQISKSMIQSPTFTKVLFEDLHTFIRNTHMQISFVATSSTDITVEAIRRDLEDMENLLGLPFQRELADETRIDTALDKLGELQQAAGEISRLVSDLMLDCESARAAGSSLQEQLREIARRLTIARQQCLPKDRVLCYTLQYTGLDVTFSCHNLTADVKIKHLEQISKEKNFNESIENAKITYENIPQRVAFQAQTHIAAIKNILHRKRTEVYKSAHDLDELARDLSDQISITQQSTVDSVEAISDWDLWRWATIVGFTAVLSVVWGVLLCGAPCGCGVTSRTVLCLISGVILSSIMCLVVWVLATIAFILGGHGQSMICHPLYDQPRYDTLGRILDTGGVFYPERGLLGRFLKRNRTSSLEVPDVLRNCDRNHPAYTTFGLNQVFDVNLVANYKVWSDLKSVFENFSIGDGDDLDILSPSLESNLRFLSILNSVNYTQYRSAISGPATKKDLSSFADQLGTVSRQLIDLESSEKIGNLGLSVRRIARNEMRKLDELRDRISYKITAIEILIKPLSKQADYSLNHMKNIQDFIDHQGWQLGKKVKSLAIFDRLENYLNEMYNHLMVKITKEIGKCKPLWRIFDSLRVYTCKLMVDPTNGIAFFCYLLILLLLGLAPVVLKLALHYREINEELLSSITHRRTTDGLIINDEGIWATPTSNTPPDVEMRDVRQSSSVVSPSLRPMSSSSSTKSGSRLGPLSKKRSSKRLSTMASRISPSRVPEIPTVSRARSLKRGRQDSLRLIDPIRWKSGSLTPRSWM